MLVTFGPAFFLPPPPPGGAAAAQVASYYLDHRSALLLAGWVGLLAFPLGFAFFTGLGLHLRGEGTLSTWLFLIALISIAVTLSVAAVQGVLALAVPYVATSVRPEELKPIADVSQLGFSAAFAFETAYFLATGFLVLRSRALPAWLGYGAVVVAPIALTASLGVIAGSGPLAAGGPVTLLAFVAGLLWWLLAAVMLVVRKPRSVYSSPQV